MAKDEETITVTSNTSVEGENLLHFTGPSDVSVGGTFDSATVTYYRYSDEYGRGPIFRTATNTRESFISYCTYMEFVVSGGGGSMSIEISARPVKNN